LIGQTFSHYRILGSLCAAGVGESYRAVDTRMGRYVALKVLPEAFAGDPEALRVALDEARSVSNPSHPHICTVHDAGEHGGRPFLVTEIVEGEPLSEWIARDAPDPQLLLDFGVQIADALQVAHDRGVVHGALDPTVVLVTEGEQIKVLDFGLARLRSAALTPAGTPVAGDLHVDPRGDIRSLGLILQAMATGRTPEEGTGTVSPDLPGELAPIVARALGTANGGAYRRANEIAADLSRAMTEAAPQYVTPPPDPATDVPERAPGSRRWLAMVAAGILLALSLLIARACA
jgi:serine/threonine protein kinase